MTEGRQPSRAADRDLAPGAQDELYRALILQSADCIIVHDLDGSIRHVNPLACRTYGYDHDELARMNVRDLDPDYEGRAEGGHFYQRMRPGEPVVFQARQRDRDGRVFPVEVRLSLIKVDGETLVQGICRDVSDRERMLRDLRESEARYRSLATNYPDGALFIVDRDGRYLAADGKALAAAGLSSEMIVGRTMPEVFPELRDTLAHFAGRAFAGEEVYYEVEYRGRHYANHAIPLPDASGEIVQMIVVAQDITERWQADAALRASEERFRLLLNDVEMVAIQGYAPDGTTQYWNEGSRQLYGYTADEALGRNLLDLIIPPEMREGVREAMAEMTRTGEPPPPGELTLMRKDGSLIEVYSSHSIVQRPGSELELFCIDVDLSEINRTKREQAALREQLLQAQKMESVGRLAGGVAHDFNNMLNVILGHAELLLEDLPADATARNDVMQIQNAARRSADLTRQLLAFARRQTVSPRLLDLNETVATMLKMLQRLIGEDVDLLWRPAADLAPVRIDPSQVDQILANLVVNARDAIGPGGGRVTIETAAEALDQEYCRSHAGFVPGSYVVLAVSDDGRGMDAEERTSIFEPFFTTKPRGEGTGLGLATVYGVVKQNNGFIDVDSEPGQGTTFRIYLPARAGEPAGVQVAAPRETPSARRGETVLVVEDEPAILDLGQRFLSDLGYQVLTAGAPDEALAVAAAHDGTIDLLLTDVVMPGMNGRELASRLRMARSGLACLYMSGYTTNVIADQGVLEDGVHFIQKPFSSHELGTRVRAALDEASD